MSSGYHTIFWGIFFASFHFNLGAIQILPVFVAWIIVANGINKLNQAEESEHFKKAYTFACFAIILSIATGVLSLTWQKAASNILLTVASPVLFGILELLSESRVLTGTIESLKNRKHTEMAAAYTKKTKYYILFFLAFLLLECAALSVMITGYATAVAILFIILRIYYMYLMNSLKKVYEVQETF